MRHTAEHSISTPAIADNDLSVLPEFIHSFCESIAGQMTRTIYDSVSEAAASVGNTVSQEEAGSFANAFLEMLNRIEFSVGPDGSVSLPSLHLHPSNKAKLIADLEAQGPAFQQELERVKQKKIGDALKSDSERRKHYKKSAGS